MSQQQMNENTLYVYAWNWFEYHAGQRMATFRFYMLFLAVLAAGFYIGVKDGYVVFAQVVAGFGAFVSLAFLILEIRNEQLVNVGRNALLYIENNEEIMQRHPGLHLLSVDRSRNPWLSYKYWFRAIYVLCLLLFVIGLLFPRIIFTDPQDEVPRFSGPRPQVIAPAPPATSPPMVEESTLVDSTTPPQEGLNETETSTKGE